MENFLPKEIFAALTDTISFSRMISGLMCSFLLSLIISQVYKFSHKTDEVRHVLMMSLVLLSVTISASMMIIGNNLATAFGLVGAVSIIRFRTTVRNPMDMSFVFITIVVGMASGLGFYILALLFTVFSCLCIIFLTLIHFGNKGTRHREYILIVKWCIDQDCRSNVEQELKTGTLNWNFDSLSVEPKRYILKYRVILSDSADPISIVRGIRQKISNFDPKLAVTLRLRVNT